MPAAPSAQWSAGVPANGSAGGPSGLGGTAVDTAEAKAEPAGAPLTLSPVPGVAAGAVPGVAAGAVPGAEPSAAREPGAAVTEHPPARKTTSATAIAAPASRERRPRLNLSL